jgi:uncharacterized protein
MRIGVTGSSGFIGRALTRALEDRGDQVIRFVRPSSPSQGVVVRWDPARQLVDEGDLANVGGFDGVVNLAGAGIADRRWSAARKVEILKSRLDSTSLLVSALRALPNGVPLLVSGSAIGVYGSRGDELLDESSTEGDDFLAHVAQQWEATAETLTQTGAIVAHLRTGIVIGQEGGSLKRQIPLFRLGLGGPLGNGHQWFSPISLVDQIRSILWIVDHSLAGPFNLTCPTPITNKDFTKDLARALHRPTVPRIPAVALDAVLGRQLAREAVLASQRVVPKALLESGFIFQNTDAASIVNSIFRSRAT